MKLPLPVLNKFIDSGFSIISIGDKKIPKIKWKQHQTTPATKAEFEKYYNLPTTHGQGICTGYDGLEVIDVDLKVFPTLKEQNDFWNELISFFRDNIDEFDSKIVIYKTQNNGYHLLYKCESVEGNKKLAKLKGSSEAVIETRGIGGYVFIYDKQISEKSYHEIQTISKEDRACLIGLCKYFNYVEETAPIQVKEQKEYKEASIKPWDDFNAKESIFDIIGNDFEVIRTLTDKYVIKRFGATSPHSGYVYKNTGCMYLFSTGTIFPNEKLISPFMAYAIKNCNGDVKQAARDIYNKGYGSRQVKEVESVSERLKLSKENIIFPVEVFPDKIQEYILAANKTLDSSIDYLGCSMLWLVSVIVGNSIRVQVKSGWEENSTTWIAVVGKAGIGKTPSINNIIFPLKSLNIREIQRYAKKSEKYEYYNSLSKEEQKNTEEIKKPKKTQFIANDITLEALVDLHEENPNAVGVFKDELAGWFKDMNKYRAGSDLEFWLSSWSGNSVAINRKTAKNSFVSMPCIPVLGGIQPSILQSFYTEENKDNGFVDRMLLCFPDLKVESYNDEEMPRDLTQWYYDYVVSFYESIKNLFVKFNEDGDIMPLVTEFSKDAKKEWKRIFNKITDAQNSQEENEYMKSMLPKQKSYIPRFSLLLQLLHSYDNPEKNSVLISKENILRAEKLSDYFINMAKKIKVNSAEIKEFKTIIKGMEGKSIKEKFLAMYEADKNLKKQEAAELLGVSVQMIYKYINEVK
jgi:hypothetical protein